MSVELVRQLLHLYGGRMRKQAEQEKALRARSVQIAAQILGGSLDSFPPAEELAKDPEFELQLIARTISQVAPEGRVRLLGALPSAIRDKVIDRMYTFRDILSLEPRALQLLLVNLDPRVVGLALVNASEKITRAIIRNVSSRTAAVYRDEISYNEKATEDDVREARRKVARKLAEMFRDGRITE